MKLCIRTTCFFVCLWTPCDKHRVLFRICQTNVLSCITERSRKQWSEMQHLLMYHSYIALSFSPRTIMSADTKRKYLAAEKKHNGLYAFQNLFKGQLYALTSHKNILNSCFFYNSLPLLLNIRRMSSAYYPLLL